MLICNPLRSSNYFQICTYRKREKYALYSTEKQMDNACIYDMVTVYFLPWKKLTTQAIVFPVIIVIIKCLADIYFGSPPNHM